MFPSGQGLSGTWQLSGGVLYCLGFVEALAAREAFRGC